MFTFSDSLPTVKPNAGFDKITLMALEKYSPGPEIDENLVYLSINIMKKIF